MITLKPFHKVTGVGRFDLIMTIVAEINGKKTTMNYAPATAKSLTTADQATTVLYSDAYQTGLWRAIRNLTPGWQVGKPSVSVPPAKPAPAAHAINRALKTPAANALIDDLYSGAPRVQPSPAPSEPTGRLVMNADGTTKQLVNPNAKVETVEQVADLRMTSNGRTVDVTTADGLMAKWVERPMGNRRVRDLATLLGIPTKDVIDKLTDSGDTSVSHQSATLRDGQARLVATAILKR